MRLFNLLVFFFWVSISIYAQQDWCTPAKDEQASINNFHTIKPRMVLTIPVVFHIVWKDSIDNISDERIQSQIDVLNTDYRKLNSDLAFVPDLFKHLSADMEIEFCLASVDPNGQSSSGITRLHTDINDIGTLNTPNIPSRAFIKHANLGGVDSWDNERYLNIWVGKFQENSGYLGQSSFPWYADKSEDGIRIDPKYVGINCINTTKKKYSYGRTLTHEIGHYLGLYHPWENKCSPTGDQVDDTPSQSSYYTGCPGLIYDNGCFTFPMTMNFMQYSDDKCMAMFTEGQKTRVWDIIQNYRSALMTQAINCNSLLKDTILSESHIKIYPNPITSCLTIELGVENQLEVQLELWDITGKLIYNEKMPSIAIRPLEIGYLPKGIYILKINSRNQSITRKILVI